MSFPIGFVIGAAAATFGICWLLGYNVHVARQIEIEIDDEALWREFFGAS